VPAKQAKQYKKNFYTFLVTGTDYEGYHTDTIMVISFDTAAHKVNVVSVPRDTMIDVPRDSKKINAAYAYGGTQELKKELESILGFAPQYSIRVDLEAFVKVVDAVGGVEYDVPQDMNMDDDAQDLHIHLVKGKQVLDGDKALQLVRFRGYPSADLGRMQTQQKFLKALARKALSPINLIKLNTFIDIFREDIKTDIGLRDLQWFAQQAIKVNSETDITVQTLPHSDTGNYLGQNYLFLSPESVVEMVNRTINPYTTGITEDDLNIIRMEDSAYDEMAFERMRVKEAPKQQ
jgi:LCP family protein required for cell wall assembly